MVQLLSVPSAAALQYVGKIHFGLCVYFATCFEEGASQNWRDRVIIRDSLFQRKDAVAQRSQRSVMMDENEISRRVIGAAIEVHKHLGPGLLESVYKQCMVRELRMQSVGVDTELVLKGQYKGLDFDIDYRMDMLVAGKVVVELKVVESLLPVHKAQLLSYMKLSGIKLGLLINFNEAVVKNGVKRIVNKL